ncbi:MAG: RHS repeat-associated core domain-containing protein [Oscillospiraceae bacterium]|nr:RHS repeat-associated core domain-containing protein [Oscillospiraceae bacterium]
MSSFTCNLDGQLVLAQGEPYSVIDYHAHTRLPVALSGAFGSELLRYDSMGRRLIKEAETSVRYRRGAGSLTQPLCEQVNGEEYLYVLTPSGQSVTRCGKEYCHVCRDHLNSVRAEVSFSVCVTAVYSGYGKSKIAGGKLRYAFANYELDLETGLYNAYRRLYAAELRRFIAIDPRMEYSSPYLYCGGDPFNLTDPTGAVSAGLVVGWILTSLLLVAGVVLTIFSLGGTSGGVATAFTAALSTLNAGQVAGYSALIVFGIGFLSGAADLIQSAAKGEHITAWQAIKTLLVEPAIAAGAAALSGLVANALFVAGTRAVFAVLGTVVTAVGTQFAASVIVAAAEGTLNQKAFWKQLGINMAVAAAEGILLSSALESVPPALRSPPKEFPNGPLQQWNEVSLEMDNRIVREVEGAKKQFDFYKANPTPSIVKLAREWNVYYANQIMEQDVVKAFDQSPSAGLEGGEELVRMHFRKNPSLTLNLIQNFGGDPRQLAFRLKLSLGQAPTLSRPPSAELTGILAAPLA